MYRVVLFFLYALSLLPLKVHYAFSGLIAWMLHRVLHYRMSTVVTNISRSFPEMSYDGIDATVRDSTDTLQMSSWNRCGA